MVEKNYYHAILIGALSMATIAGSCAHASIKTFLDDYAIKTTCELLGSKPLSTEHETFIKSIAAEMGMHEPIIIRKMNHTIMQVGGYNNAFSAFPVFASWFPMSLSSQPLLFISEGFFEDLSPEEQRFLIGHELVHLKEQHFLYEGWKGISVLVLLGATWFICDRKYHWRRDLSLPFLVPCLMAYYMICLTCRRQKEKEADHMSLVYLKSYDGCLKLCERFKTKYGLPIHEPYYGLLSDHPSFAERKEYCTLMQQNNKDLL